MSHLELILAPNDSPACHVNAFTIRHYGGGDSRQNSPNRAFLTTILMAFGGGGISMFGCSIMSNKSAFPPRRAESRWHCGAR